MNKNLTPFLLRGYLSGIGMLATLVVCLKFPVCISASEVPLFNEEKAISLRIVAPLKTLKDQRGDDPEYLTAVMFVRNQSGEEISFDVKIKARGNYRRLEKTCSFPSYWINFKKKQVEGTAFEGMDKVKVVAHCRDSHPRFDRFIHKEYLAYKTYNLISDKSFRVRLAHIDYIDTESRYHKEQQIAFFIEPTASLEQRLQVTQVNDQYVMPSLYETEDLARAELFQYFVGNTDFTFFSSVDECCHNGKAFEYSDGSRGHLPIPYDFDLTGLINAPYAKPNPALKIQSVRTRVYRGVRHQDQVWASTIERFTNKKEEIYKLWENYESLSERDRKEAIKYFDRFYRTISDEQKLEKEIEKKMRGIERLDEYIARKIKEAKDN